jgi:hypothetical protein
MSHSNPQVSQAAQAIIALINSQPRSPTEDEIVATIRRYVMPMALPDPAFGVPRGASSSRPIVPAPAMPAPDVGASTALQAAYVASDWHRVLSAYLDAANTNVMEEDKLDAHEDQLTDVTRAICATPVRTFGDLVVRAAIAADWFRYEISDPTSTDDQVLAALVRGVFDLEELEFDARRRALDR